MPPDDNGGEWARWDRERLTKLEQRIDALETPMRNALNEIQRWQAGAIERDQRREDSMRVVADALKDFQKAMDERLKKIEDSVPNKAVNELFIKAVIGLGTMIISAVIALWMGAIGIRKP